MTRTLPLAILCAMSGALVGALVGFGLAWIVLSGSGPTIFGTGDAGLAQRQEHRPKTEVAGWNPVPGAPRGTPVPFGAVADDRAGSGGGSRNLSLSAPVQLDDGGGVSSAMEGWASYCAPTPTKCQSWGGSAKVGAVSSFRYGDTPYRVTVCRLDRPSTCVVVRIVSFCACGTHVIDLSPSAFERLERLSRGTVRVTVVSGGGPAQTLPPTDTSPTSPLHLPATH